MDFKEYIQNFDFKVSENEKISFIKLGSEKIDLICGGIPKNNITVVSGSTGCGKSMLLTNIAYVMCKNNPKLSIIYISLENAPCDDQERIESVIDYYGKCNLDNLKYMNLMELDSSEKISIIQSVVNMIDYPYYEVIIIDGTELLFNQSPERMHEDGEKFMKFFRNANGGLCPKTIIISWQNKKDTISKKFEDVSTFDLFASSAVSTRAALVLAVGFITESGACRHTVIKCLKSRYRTLEENPYGLKDLTEAGNRFALLPPKNSYKEYPL